MEEWFLDMPWREVALRGLKVKWADVVADGAEHDAKWERDFMTETAHIVPSRYSVGAPETDMAIPVRDGEISIPIVTYFIFRLGDTAYVRERDEVLFGYRSVGL
jgi:hypothetical protein